MDWVYPGGAREANRDIRIPENPNTVIRTFQYSTTDVPSIAFSDVDEQEVKNIAQFIASLDKDIPYSLLAFYPHFYVEDLPTTSRMHAFRCLEIAKSAGNKHVRIGNLHLLGEAY